MDISKELKENQTVLAIVSSAKYNDFVIANAKKLSGKSVCYVTLNKTYESVKELLRKKKVKTDNFVFIDAISKTIKGVPEADDCYFVASPGALTEISLVISKFLKHNFDYLVFDSLTNMIIYAKKAPVAKFLSSIVNKIKSTDTKAVFYVLKAGQDESVIKQSGMFVDKILEAD